MAYDSHPRMILATTPANALDGHTVFILSEGLLSLACMYTCTAGRGGKEFLAGKHTTCNILEARMTGSMQRW